MTIQAQMLPNLEIDVETPWPLKREGKQVYAKLIDFGGLPAPYGLRGKTHNVPDIEWSQISWDHSYVASSADGRRRSLALVSTPASSGGTMPWRFLVDSTSVQVNMLTNVNYQEWDTVAICLLYTKTGEGAQSGSLIVPGPDGTVLTSRDNELVWEEGGGSAGCECEIATPDKNGLVPEGGLPGQTYRVSADGAAYEWASDDVVSVDTNLTLYVRLDGDDANSGLEDTPEGACRTLKGVFDKIMFKYRAATSPLLVDVRLSPGVHEGGLGLHQNIYSSGFTIPRILGAGSGQTTISAASNYCVSARGVQLHLDGLTLACPVGTAHVRGQLGSYVTFGPDVRMTGTPTSACIYMETGSYFLANDRATGLLDVSVTSGDSIFKATGGATLSVAMKTLRLNGSCTRTVIADNAEVKMQPLSATGNMTGKRYEAIRHGIVDTNGKGANFIPGSIAGTVATGGLYL